MNPTKELYDFQNDIFKNALQRCENYGGFDDLFDPFPDLNDQIRSELTWSPINVQFNENFYRAFMTRSEEIREGLNHLDLAKSHQRRQGHLTAYVSDFQIFQKSNCSVYFLLEILTTCQNSEMAKIWKEIEFEFWAITKSNTYVVRYILPPLKICWAILEWGLIWSEKRNRERHFFMKLTVT